MNAFLARELEHRILEVAWTPRSSLSTSSSNCAFEKVWTVTRTRALAQRPLVGEAVTRTNGQVSVAGERRP
jgi:hypothetical protein